MNPLLPFLQQQNVVILDGALATELERRGADLRDPLWSAKLLLENPGVDPARSTTTISEPAPMSPPPPATRRPSPA